MKNKWWKKITVPIAIFFFIVFFCDIDLKNLPEKIYLSYLKGVKTPISKKYCYYKNGNDSLISVLSISTSKDKNNLIKYYQGKKGISWNNTPYKVIYVDYKINVLEIMKDSTLAIIEVKREKQRSRRLNPTYLIYVPVWCLKDTLPN